MRSSGRLRGRNGGYEKLLMDGTTLCCSMWNEEGKCSSYDCLMKSTEFVDCRWRSVSVENLKEEADGSAEIRGVSIKDALTSDMSRSAMKP